MDSKERGKKIAMAKKLQQGRYQGGRVPFGYKKTKDGFLEETGKLEELKKILNNKEELEKILKHKDSSRILSLRKIARILGVSHSTISRKMKELNSD